MTLNKIKTNEEYMAEGFTADEVALIRKHDELFNKYNIEDERTNDKTTLLLCGIGTNIKKLERLKKITK